MTRNYVVIAVIIALPLLILAGLSVFRSIRRTRRTKTMRLPFPPKWIAHLEKNLPPYDHLSGDLKRQLHGRILVFLSEKNFEGCGGQEISDEIRVTIAAQACMLLLNRKSTFFPKLDTVLVYPSAYVAGGKGIMGGRLEETSIRLGESWQTGAVVLSWDDVRRGASNFEDGHNVTFHEFAHQLDQEDGCADGTPILERLSRYSAWARILGAEYEELQGKIRGGKRTVMDRYGTTNAAEFFAVATETFFEKPRQLKEKHPELYEELKDYYKLDPEAWH